MDQTAVQDSLNNVSQFISSSQHEFVWFQFESNLVYLIAVAIGFFIIFISYFFGGGKKNKVKIFLSIVTGILVGVLTLPLLLKLPGHEKAGVIAFYILLDLIFTATVTCHMYELVVIGTHEAFDQNPIR
ncbi:hypothetical protein EH223_04315 [candidate division KSB1 bacterium]|nr:hypothetical protein [candidate division KSB1 bacterium]RQW05508.1 MAG: hypothetical protein EH223_04315 [candidate division KSB1 bacterium]